MFKGAEKYCD